MKRKPTLEAKEVPSSAEKQIDKSGDVIKLNHKCLALFAGDGKWYPAVVNAISGERFTVTYTGYGDQAELSLDEVAPLSSKGTKGPLRPIGEREYEYTVGPDGEIEIPKSLKILPTDSEDVRNSKRRRIHAIKYQHRIKKLDENTNTRKNAWQDFNKVSNKKQTGFITGRQKKSIFSSPDTVDGKVGVTGSGKPVTEQPSFNVREVAREKRRLNEASDIIIEETERHSQGRERRNERRRLDT